MRLLPRDARRNKRGLCCRPVSVRLQSNTFAYCIQTAEDIVKLISRPGSAIILAFDTVRRYLIPRESRQRGRQCTGGGNNFTTF